MVSPVVGSRSGLGGRRKWEIRDKEARVPSFRVPLRLAAAHRRRTAASRLPMSLLDRSPRGHSHVEQRTAQLFTGVAMDTKRRLLQYLDELKIALSMSFVRKGYRTDLARLLDGTLSIHNTTIALPEDVSERATSLQGDLRSFFANERVGILKSRRGEALAILQRVRNSIGTEPVSPVDVFTTVLRIVEEILPAETGYIILDIRDPAQITVRIDPTTANVASDLSSRVNDALGYSGDTHAVTVDVKQIESGFVIEEVTQRRRPLGAIGAVVVRQSVRRSTTC